LYAHAATVADMPTDTDPRTVVPTRTFSLAEAAEILCGACGPAEQKWLRERLIGNAEPQLSGYKVQRRWRMTEDDLIAAIDTLRPKRNHVRIPALTSMTARSQRRLAV